MFTIQQNVLSQRVGYSSRGGILQATYILQAIPCKVRGCSSGTYMLQRLCFRNVYANGLAPFKNKKKKQLLPKLAKRGPDIEALNESYTL